VKIWLRVRPVFIWRDENRRLKNLILLPFQFARTGVSPNRSAAFLIWGSSLAVFLLPLILWPGIPQPFSTPKWLLLGVWSLFFPILWWLQAVRKFPLLKNSAVQTTGLLWICCLALSSLMAPKVSLGALLAALAPLPLFLAVNLVSPLSSRIVQALLGASALLALLAVLQWLRMDPFIALLGWQPQTFSNPRMRIYGTLGNPNFVAAWLCAVLPVVFAFFAKSFRTFPHRPWVGAVLVMLQLLAILAAGSRVLLITLAVLLLVWGGGRMKREMHWILLLLIPLAALLLWISPSRPLARTLAGRWFIADIILSHWREIPLFGFGPGTFPAKYAEWQGVRQTTLPPNDPLAAFVGPLDHAHNDYLEMMVEYGFPGMLAFVAMAGTFLWIFLGRRHQSEMASAIMLIKGSSLCILLAVALVDFPFHRPAEWGLLWIIMGLEPREKPDFSKHQPLELF
jgi:putative inorganic carbon (hco3(-)) transporter